MATEAGKATARRLVLGVMSEKGWNPATLGDNAGIDYGTAGDFLNGKRWPKIATLGKIDRALGWTPGTLAAVGEGLQDTPTETVSAAEDTVGQLLFRRPEGLTDQQWDEMRSRMEQGWEWELRQAARER